MHIGNKIKEIVEKRGITSRWLASQILCDRTNIYLIYKKSTIDTELLQKISKILDYDFFKDYSDETFLQDD
ncbi:MAG: helix-turn-helix domain-containing protein [Bacteroidales bacterium]|nr:helix-turn-helix domain-containing protein [Bacteroidales bacterium]